MAEGLSFESFAGLVSVGKRVLYDWADSHPEFLQAKSEGLEKNRMFWEKLGRDHVINESFGQGAGSKSLNSTVWIFNMKNRFPQEWRDKKDIEHAGKDGGPIRVAAMTKEEVDAELKRLDSIIDDVE
jgi:hypothetical protein